MEVDRADVDDVGAVVDLWVALANEQREHGSHVLAGKNSDFVHEELLRHAVTDGMLVARSDSVVGFVTFSVEHASYRKDHKRGIIEHLYVEPTHRNQGVGARLLTAAESELAATVDVVVLETLADNEAARRFYRRHDYTPHRVQLAKTVRNDNHSRDDE